MEKRLSSDASDTELERGLLETQEDSGLPEATVEAIDEDFDSDEVIFYPDLENLFERNLTKDEKKDLGSSLLEKQEDTRSLLAKILIFLLCATFALTFIMSWLVLFLPTPSGEDKGERYAYSKDILGTLITTQTGLVGAVLGFYFGSKVATKNEEESNKK